MVEFQRQVASNVVAFIRRLSPTGHAPACRLTPRDRMEITGWHDAARLAGYDRLVIHDRDVGDAIEVGNFLSVYRRGDAWSRWGFARSGVSIHAWCCLSGADVGTFDTLGDALNEVLNGPGPVRMTPAKMLPARVSEPREGIVTALMTRLSPVG